MSEPKNQEATSGFADAGSLGDQVHESSHPVLLHKITILRSSSTIPASFRAALREVTYHLAYEATNALTTRSVKITVPVGKEHIDAEGHKLVERVSIIPILRSGLGMVDPLLELLPNAEIHHIGMYHISGQPPVQYFNRLPRKCESDVAYILDPVVATAATILSVVAVLKKWGVSRIHLITVIAAREGLKALLENHPELQITVGTIDDNLNDKGKVLPGLGDSGDRQFRTPLIDEEDEEALLHFSKRKRSMVDIDQTKA